ncbi:MAG: M28 family peptidase [Clostridia bacterium]|nr:M28 family peptidase [Clostridia bacterium]
MKKIIATILLIMLSLSALAFSGCATEVMPPKTELFTATSLADLHEDFLKANPNRTSQTKSTEKDGEEKASEWIHNYLSGYDFDTLSVNKINGHTTTYGDAFDSQNVVATVYGGKNTTNGKIVIGASYDNVYDTVNIASYNGMKGYAYFEGSKAEGASCATGTATVLALATYFAHPDVKKNLTVDVDFVFYGMSKIDSYGSKKYLSDLGNQGRNNLLLAINVDGLGGDKLHAYFDETARTHGKFIMDVASKAGFDGYLTEPSATQIDYALKLVERLPYTPPSLMSDVVQYFDNYNVCAFTSSAGESFSFDRESNKGDNLRHTPMDTLSNLKSRNSDYANQMAVVAETVVKSLTAEGFVKAMTDSKAEIGSYAWLTIPLVSSIPIFVICIAVIIPLVIYVRKKEREYATDPKNRPNVKFAVFGMDYEEPKENDIYVDISSPESGAEPPNGPIDPFDDFDKD